MSQTAAAPSRRRRRSAAAAPWPLFYLVGKSFGGDGFSSLLCVPWCCLRLVPFASGFFLSSRARSSHAYTTWAGPVQKAHGQRGPGKNVRGRLCESAWAELENLNSLAALSLFVIWAVETVKWTETCSQSAASHDVKKRPKIYVCNRRRNFREEKARKSHDHSLRQLLLVTRHGIIAQDGHVINPQQTNCRPIPYGYVCFPPFTPQQVRFFMLSDLSPLRKESGQH